MAFIASIAFWVFFDNLVVQLVVRTLVGVGVGIGVGVGVGVGRFLEPFCVQQ